jgi:hypothetical protein
MAGAFKLWVNGGSSHRRIRGCHDGRHELGSKICIHDIIDQIVRKAFHVTGQKENGRKWGVERLGDDQMKLLGEVL